MQPPNVEGLGLRLVTSDQTGPPPPAPTSSVELTRGVRGGYGWVLKSYRANIYEALAEVQEIDQQLRAAYLP
jgi:hypothetical protein